jgi:hypothetical protein
MPPRSRSPGVLGWLERLRTPLWMLAAAATIGAAWSGRLQGADGTGAVPGLLAALGAPAVALELARGVRAPRTRARASLALACLAGWLLAFASPTWDGRFVAACAYEATAGALWTGLKLRDVDDRLRALRRAASTGVLLLGDLGALAAIANAREAIPAGLLSTAALVAVFAHAAIGLHAPRTRWIAGEDRPCLSFACPRCGASERFARGPSPCGECGLLVRVDWQMPERELEALQQETLREPTFVCRCPVCADRARWSAGLCACRRCGTPVHARWNRG